VAGCNILVCTSTLYPCLCFAHAIAKGHLLNNCLISGNCHSQRHLRRNFMARSLFQNFFEQYLVGLLLPGDLVWPLALCPAISSYKQLPGRSPFTGSICGYPRVDVGLGCLENQVDPLGDPGTHYARFFRPGRPFLFQLKNRGQRDVSPVPLPCAHGLGLIREEYE